MCTTKWFRSERVEIDSLCAVGFEIFLRADIDRPSPLRYMSIQLQPGHFEESRVLYYPIRLAMNGYERISAFLELTDKFRRS